MNAWLLKRKWYGVMIMVIIVLYYFCLPDPLFHEPYSAVLEDRHGQLLSASIATDGQWRFPETVRVPEKYAQALRWYEDKRFHHHPGVDPMALARAIRQNISRGAVVSGGSTITMQVIRLARKSSSRNLWEKLVEAVWATRLEWRYSKDEILALYASHAPFGGNVVGIEAACWRYFGREPDELSWAEAALLAVLPNAPALIHPGKNRNQLLRKRNALLRKLQEEGVIDNFTYELAVQEPIPDEPLPLPRHARHLLARAVQEGKANRKVVSTVDLALQQRVEHMLDDHHRRLSANRIYNLAAVVADVHTGEVLVYAGNVSNTSRHHGDDVDVITAPRSTGSILKPFLYAAMLDEGKILPRTLLPDIPTYINGFAPRNFSKEYDGAVPANDALVRSLNIPAVYMLREYRYEKFHALLRELGMSTLSRPPDHYGLSLILGGAEGTLWDIAGMYASMGRVLNHYQLRQGKNRYHPADIHALRYTIADDIEETRARQESGVLSAGAIYTTLHTLRELYRPGEESGWKMFSSTHPIAWKTGTSFGFRDAWAVGVTPHYVVAVWAGNADGEGRPGLTGTEAAAPVMLDIFSQLQERSWFQKPAAELTLVPTCARSGHRAGSYCDKLDTLAVPNPGLRTTACPYHQRIHLSRDGRYRLNSACAAVDDMVPTSWFVLPPVQEYYYKSRHAFYYKTLPPFRPGCVPAGGASMELIYPRQGARLYIPRDLNGRMEQVIFQVAHHDPGATIYWHLDDAYVGTTNGTHHLSLSPEKGQHTLTLVDQKGESQVYQFTVISDR